MNKLYAAIAGIMLASGLQPPAHGKEAEKNPYLAIDAEDARLAALQRHATQHATEGT